MYLMDGKPFFKPDVEDQIIKLYDEMNRITRLYNAARWDDVNLDAYQSRYRAAYQEIYQLSRANGDPNLEYVDTLIRSCYIKMA